MPCCDEFWCCTVVATPLYHGDSMCGLGTAPKSPHFSIRGTRPKAKVQWIAHYGFVAPILCVHRPEDSLTKRLCQESDERFDTQSGMTTLTGVRQHFSLLWPDLSQSEGECCILGAIPRLHRSVYAPPQVE